MGCFDNGTAIELAKFDNLPLRDARGTILRVTRGSLWITQENDTRDLVLRTGDSLAVERDGLTIVEAQADSTVCVTGRNVDAVLAAQRAVTMPVPTVWGRLRGALSWLTPASTRTVPYF